MKNSNNKFIKEMKGLENLRKSSLLRTILLILPIMYWLKAKRLKYSWSRRKKCWRRCFTIEGRMMIIWTEDRRMRYKSSICIKSDNWRKGFRQWKEI